MGPPQFLSMDQPTPYISREVKDYISEQRITFEEAFYHIPGSIGVVERYRSPLRKA